MAHNPFGGDMSFDDPTLGEVRVRWGMGWGAMLLPAGIMLIAGGLLVHSTLDESKDAPEGELENETP